jgi:hypothetical protein
MAFSSLPTSKSCFIDHLNFITVYYSSIYAFTSSKELPLSNVISQSDEPIFAW